MSLTSYRAAPPRVGNWANGEGRIANGDGLRPFAIRPSRFAFSCVEEEPPVLCRPGDDLLSRVLRQSTIGAEAFDGRVRDGIGSYRLAESHQAGKERLGLKQKGLFWGGKTAAGFRRPAVGKKPSRLPAAEYRLPCSSFSSMRTIKPNERLVPVSSTRCRAYTPGLSTWWSSTALQGELVLRLVSRLDAFSGYPFRI